MLAIDSSLSRPTTTMQPNDFLVAIISLWVVTDFEPAVPTAEDGHASPARSSAVERIIEFLSWLPERQSVHTSDPAQFLRSLVEHIAESTVASDCIERLQHELSSLSTIDRCWLFCDRLKGLVRRDADVDAHVALFSSRDRMDNIDTAARRSRLQQQHVPRLYPAIKQFARSSAVGLLLRRAIVLVDAAVFDGLNALLSTVPGLQSAVAAVAAELRRAEVCVLGESVQQEQQHYGARPRLSLSQDNDEYMEEDGRDSSDAALDNEARATSQGRRAASVATKSIPPGGSSSHPALSSRLSLALALSSDDYIGAVDAIHAVFDVGYGSGTVFSALDMMHDSVTPLALLSQPGSGTSVGGPTARALSLAAFSAASPPIGGVSVGRSLLHYAPLALGALELRFGRIGKPAEDALDEALRRSHASGDASAVSLVLEAQENLDVERAAYAAAERFSAATLHATPATGAATASTSVRLGGGADDGDGDGFPNFNLGCGASGGAGAWTALCAVVTARLHAALSDARISSAERAAKLDRTQARASDSCAWRQQARVATARGQHTMLASLLSEGDGAATNHYGLRSSSVGGSGAVLCISDVDAAPSSISNNADVAAVTSSVSSSGGSIARPSGSSSAMLYQLSRLRSVASDTAIALGLQYATASDDLRRMGGSAITASAFDLKPPSAAGLSSSPHEEISSESHTSHHRTSFLPLPPLHDWLSLDPAASLREGGLGCGAPATAESIAAAAAAAGRAWASASSTARSPRPGSVRTGNFNLRRPAAGAGGPSGAPQTALLGMTQTLSTAPASAGGRTRGSDGMTLGRQGAAAASAAAARRGSIIGGGAASSSSSGGGVPSPASPALWSTPTPLSHSEVCALHADALAQRVHTTSALLDRPHYSIPLSNAPHSSNPLSDALGRPYSSNPLSDALGRPYSSNPLSDALGRPYSSNPLSDALSLAAQVAAACAVPNVAVEDILDALCGDVNENSSSTGSGRRQLQFQHAHHKANTTSPPIVSATQVSVGLQFAADLSRLASGCRVALELSQSSSSSYVTQCDDGDALRLRTSTSHHLCGRSMFGDAGRVIEALYSLVDSDDEGDLGVPAAAACSNDPPLGAVSRDEIGGDVRRGDRRQHTRELLDALLRNIVALTPCGPAALSSHSHGPSTSAAAAAALGSHGTSTPAAAAAASVPSGQHWTRAPFAAAAEEEEAVNVPSAHGHHPLAHGGRSASTAAAAPRRNAPSHSSDNSVSLLAISSALADEAALVARSFAGSAATFATTSPGSHHTANRSRAEDSAGVRSGRVDSGIEGRNGARVGSAAGNIAANFKFSSGSSGAGGAEEVPSAEAMMAQLSSCFETRGITRAYSAALAATARAMRWATASVLLSRLLLLSAASMLDDNDDGGGSYCGADDTSSGTHAVSSAAPAAASTGSSSAGSAEAVAAVSSSPSGTSCCGCCRRYASAALASAALVLAKDESVLSLLGAGSGGRNGGAAALSSLSSFVLSAVNAVALSDNDTTTTSSSSYRLPLLPITLLPLTLISSTCPVPAAAATRACERLIGELSVDAAGSTLLALGIMSSSSRGSPRDAAWVISTAAGATGVLSARHDWPLFGLQSLISLSVHLADAVGLSGRGGEKGACADSSHCCCGRCAVLQFGGDERIDDDSSVGAVVASSCALLSAACTTAVACHLPAPGGEALQAANRLFMKRRVY